MLSEDLFKLGLKVNRLDSNRRNPLYYAATSGDEELVDFILDNDGHVDSNNNFLALWKAIAIKNKAMVESLLSIGALDVQNSSMLYSIMRGQARKVKSLLLAGMSP